MLFRSQLPFHRYADFSQLCKGVSRDLAEAFKLFERAANQGDGWGLNNLGGMYEMGWGAPKDHAKAATYYKQALEKGITSAQTNLARVVPAQQN